MHLAFGDNPLHLVLTSHSGDNADGAPIKGTIVDASIIEAPSSTKNRSGERDPEMHQTKKGNQWHFGMKAHIGVDAVYGNSAQPERHSGQCA